MAKFTTTKTATKYGTIWEDPDTTKNRIWIDNIAYDKTTLTPRPAEMWYWQTRINTFNISTDYDNYGPIQLSTEGLDGTVFSASQNDIYYMPGIFNTWQASLDLQDVIPTLIWRTTARNGRTIATYPRSITTNETTGDWWCGEDMNIRSQSWRQADTAQYCHLFERTDQLNFNALSWSYSSTTITVNWNAHGLMPGDTVIISGATATTNAPNGTWIVYTTATNSFTFVATVAPTGTAGGTMNVIAECRSGFGFETENGTPMMRFNVIRGYQWTYEDNSSTAGISRPTYTTLNSSDWKFYMGRDADFVYLLQMAGGTTNAYSVYKYYIPRGAGATTTVISALTPTNPGSAIIPAFPSNIRHDTSTRKVFYSGHYNTSGFLAPMRLVWTKGTSNVAFTPTNVTYSTTTITVTSATHNLKVGDVISVTGLTSTTNPPNGNYFPVVSVAANNNQFTYTALATPTGTIAFASANISGITTSTDLANVIYKADCTLTYPVSTSHTTYANVATASSWNGNGINNWWCQPYQFAVNGNNYITFTVSDSFYYSSTTRFPSVKSRTWLTYRIDSSNDASLIFHSGINFPTVTDFPLSWAPYGANTNYQDRVLIFSSTGTGVLKFNDTTFDADSWSYTANTDGLNTGTITVTKTAHGLNVGDSITTSGATTSTSNPPNGVYKVYSVPDANTFKFIADSNMSGVPIGTAGGTMNVRLGWQGKYRNNIRTRGYGVDSLNRLWLTSRNSTVGRVTVHLISESIPSTVNISLQDYDTTGVDDTKYIYSGTDINTNLKVDVYNSLDERLATEITLTITGDTMRFATGDYYTKTITTSSAATTNVAVVITGAGRNSISVTKNL
jgi:hypothetical protein